MSHPFHPVSELFPLMTGSPFDELVADIKANGLREAIWRHEGQIIDGRNRYFACDKCGVEPTYREWDGDGDLTKFVISLNLHRRHLNEAQRAMVASRLATRAPGGDRKSHNQNQNSDFDSIPSIPIAADMLKVSHQSVSVAKKIRREAIPEVTESVERGELSLRCAERVSDLPKEDQPEALKSVLENKQPPPKANKHSNGNGIVPKTRTRAGRKAPAAIRGAIGTLVGLASGLDSFTVKDAAPTAEESEQWERDLAVVISAINRFRRQLKEHVNEQQGQAQHSDRVAEDR